MRYRNSSTISIKRQANGRVVDIATVPITEQARRKYTLMSEDSVTLSFSLDEGINLKVGDYIDDEVFGRFVMVKNYSPRYNTNTGVYDYTPIFEAEYMMWRNWLHCLIAYDKDNNPARMECNWGLTSRLSDHASQITANLSALGLGGWNYSIAVENAVKSLYIAYNAISILDALNKIAEAYECEWWVTTADKTIHFGKCENNDNPLVFAISDNIAAMDIKDDRTEYANRIFVFGGTRNIPLDYDRNLIFSASNLGDDTFKDSNRQVTIDMLGGVTSSNLTFNSPSISNNVITFNSNSTGSAFNRGGVIRGDITIISRFNQGGIHYDLDVYITKTGTRERTILTESGTASYQLRRDITINEELSSGSSYGIVVVITFTASGLSFYGNEVSSSITATPNNQSIRTTITYNDTLYPVTFTGDYDDMVFAFVNAIPMGFGDNSKYYISSINASDIPLRYYTEEYAHGTLSTIGERRLHLPLAQCPNRYIDHDTHDEQTKVVERAIVFDDIYPRLELKITSIRAEDVKIKVTNADGSISYENAQRYYFTVQKVGGGAFNFNTSYILDGVKLQGLFYAPENSSFGNLLAGMTFDLGFSNAEQEYNIIRNEDYGVLLPNNVLRPQVGDTLTLIGWNPRAINNLGLVEVAENKLYERGQDYVDALVEGGYTINCTLMSDYAPTLAVDNEDYGLPTEGTRVTVSNNALPNGAITSRVIGYELKLDMPWDSPVFTIGETQAYSRLAKIEKQITQLR